MIYLNRRTADFFKDIALLYTDLRTQLYDDLEQEFRNDFLQWRASVKRDLSIRFEEPTVQFDTGSAVVKDSFKAILANFFPRYIGILTAPKYRDAIEEVRIEGHTSSMWRGLAPEQAYYENMRLSQERTREVLMYVFSIDKVRDTELLRWLLPVPRFPTTIRRTTKRKMYFKRPSDSSIRRRANLTDRGCWSE